MSDIVQFFSSIDRVLLHDMTTTLVFVIVLIITRAVIRKAILHRTTLPSHVKQRWLGNLRNVALVIMVLGMLMIWGNQLENFAVSLAAVAAAFVLATREMLMCILGSIFRTSTDMCRIGDRIEINGIKGQIIDMNLFSTLVLESTQSCSSKSTVGRVVNIPNSMFFSQAIYNEARLGNFVTLTVPIKLERDDDWQLAEEILLESSNGIMDEYADKLARSSKQVSHVYALEIPLQTAHVRILVDDINYVTLHLQLPVPLGKTNQVEQRILREFLQRMPPTTNYRTFPNKNLAQSHLKSSFVEVSEKM
jgi:small-conductance mechanosensitive channel